MSDDNKSFKLSFGMMEILLFLVFCNLYQPNAQICALTLGTIYFSLIWASLMVIGIAIIIWIVVSALS